MVKIKIKLNADDEDILSGGSADNVNFDIFDQEELKLGSEEEMEHTDDPNIATEISADHLTSNPHYYTDLKKAKLEPEKQLPRKKAERLSKYWLKRAKKRAKRGSRGWPSTQDKDWAKEQQAISKKINTKIKNTFGKHMEITEEIASTIQEFIKRMKEQKASLYKPDSQTLKSRPKPPKKIKPKKGYPITGKARSPLTHVGNFGPAK